MLTQEEQLELDQLNQIYAPQEQVTEQLRLPQGNLTPNEYAELQQLNQIYAPQEQVTEQLRLPPQSNLTPEGNQWVNAPDLRGDPGQGQESNISRIVSAAPGMAETAVDSIAEGVTLGFKDEIAGAIGTPIRMLMNPDLRITEAYAEARDASRGRSDQLADENPITAFTGELAGGMATGLGLLNKIKYAPTVANTLKVGALEGSAYGLGSSEADTLSRLAQDTALGAGTGILGAGVGHGIARAVRPKGGSPQEKIVNEATEFGYPLKISDITQSNQAAALENILDYIPLSPSPYVNDLGKRSKILNKAFVNEAMKSGSIKRPNIDEGDVGALYKYVRESLPNEAVLPSGGLKVDWKRGRNNFVPGVKDDFVEALVQKNAINPVSGSLNPAVTGKKLGDLNYKKYGSTSEDAFSRLMRVGEKFPPLGQTISNDPLSQLKHIAGGATTTALGLGTLLGPAPLATILPAVGLPLGAKLANRLARDPMAIQKVAQAGAIGSQQIDKDNIMGLLGLLGGGGYVAKTGLDALSGAYNMKKPKNLYK